MENQPPVTVRMFGLLHSARSAAGLPSLVEVEVPADGTTAREIAVNLELDLDIIEGVFVNRTVYDIGHIVRPGDRIAFVPQGTPGPHRVYLGLYRAGQETHNDSGDTAD
ncbi:MAG: MoaD/ThiS family protein [Actinomycetota bacterium]|nr:MoaD/ThiS family protein [Actinomycetota bacterium]